MKNYMEKIKIELKESYFINGWNIPAGTQFLVDTVLTNKNDEKKKLYKCSHRFGDENDTTEILIPDHKCFVVLEKETDPEKLKELDNWFNKETEKHVNEPEPSVTELELKLIKDGELKKSIKFKPEDIENITLDNVINLKEKLDAYFDEKENKDDGDFYGGGVTPKILFNTNGISLIFDEYSYSETRNKYWGWALKFFNIKEPEKPKLNKLKRGSVERYGISRFPDYTDMFYIETDATKDIINEYWEGNVREMVKKLSEDGYKANVINIDYILLEDVGDIEKTNSLEY